MMTEATQAEDQKLVERVLAGERRALAKAITLIESTRTDHRQRADKVLHALMPYTGKSIRLGITGVPGAGKSTFIEALGVWLVEQGKRPAVLAIDPSSSISGGSILGDKTRMEALSVRPEAFIRPSPSAGSLGGVANKTREAMLLTEAAGYDVIIVETVGVGQSETMVAGMVDLFVLIQLPNAGDDLQAIKKGIVEIADLVLINKSDLNPQAAAYTRAQWKNALAIIRHKISGWIPPVLTISATKKEGVKSFWEEVSRFRDIYAKSGEFADRRKRQSLDWMWNLIDSGLRDFFREHPQVRAELFELSHSVAEGQVSPTAAANRLLNHLTIIE